MYYFDNYLLSGYYVPVIIVDIQDATVKSKDAGGWEAGTSNKQVRNSS